MLYALKIYDLTLKLHHHNMLLHKSVVKKYNYSKDGIKLLIKKLFIL